MIEQKKVIIRKGSQIVNGLIEFTKSEPWELRLLNEAGNKIEFDCKANDLFECLTILREQYLEKRDSYILCNGSRLDVYPSRMSRQMSGGLKAYVMKLGKPARRTDLIDIFDELEDLSLIATVREQNDFKNKWMESL